jgi:5-methylcytosine-specific restriction enzyme subunit McrC
LVFVRGAIDFEHSIQNVSFRKGKAFCRFEDLSPAVLHNRILRTTLRNLSAVHELDQDLKVKLINLWKKMGEVPEIAISRKLFHGIQLNRNNSVYFFLMNVCELAYNLMLPNENGKETGFVDFIRDEIKMRMLFQHFVRNFYATHLKGCSTSADTIPWDAIAEDTLAKKYLPVMQTDITIRSKEKTWVIDTKYYKEVFSARENWNEKIKSENLYQMFAYLKNLDKKGGQDAKAEGILLYPTTSEDVRLSYAMQGHKVRICTVNLATEWGKIHEELLGLISDTLPIRN